MNGIINYALKALNERNLFECERICGAILRETPEDGMIQHILGIARYEQGDFEEAAFWLRKGLENTLNPQACFNLGNALRKLGRREEALLAYSMAAQNNVEKAKYNLKMLELEPEWQKEDPKNTRIYVCCHQPGNPFNDNMHTPIHVGRANSKHSLDMLGDDTGDNISHLNDDYMEICGHYWALKNAPSDIENIGFCHYRRYMAFNYYGCIGGRSFDLMPPDPRWATYLAKHNDIVVPDNGEMVDSLVGNWIRDSSPEVIAKYPKLVRDHTCCITQCVNELLRMHPEDTQLIIDLFLSTNTPIKLNWANIYMMKRPDFEKMISWELEVYSSLVESLHRMGMEIPKLYFLDPNRRAFGIAAGIFERLLILYVEKLRRTGGAVAVVPYAMMR